MYTREPKFPPSSCNFATSRFAFCVFVIKNEAFTIFLCTKLLTTFTKLLVIKCTIPKHTRGLDSINKFLRVAKIPTLYTLCVMNIFMRQTENRW